MPRSSRHKPSKHSAREAREYSDAEREPVLKERKGREDGGSGGSSSRHLKDSTSGEKRKLESKSVDLSKDSVALGVVEYNDGCGGGSGTVSSSKKRKEKVVDDRWTGGDSKEEHELSKSEMKREKEKEEGRGSGDSKRSSRREDAGFHAEEGKRSGSKVESKHHRSERKERGEKEAERDRKGSRSDRLDRSEKSERLVDVVSVSEITAGEEKKRQVAEERGSKHGGGNSDWNLQEGLRNPEPERDTDRRVRRKRDGSGDADRHQDGVRDLEDSKMSSRDEIAKYAKYKDNGQKDERNRDRFQEGIDKDGWDQDEKQRENRSTRDHNSGRSDEKHMRNEKKDLDPSLKKSKPHISEYDRELDRDNKERDKDRDYDRDRGRERERDRDRSRHAHDRDREHDDREPEPDRERERDLGRVHDQDRDLDRVHDRERDLDRVHDRERDLDRVHDRERDLDRVHDRERDLDRVHDRERDLDRDRDRGRDRYRRERDRVHDRDNDGGRERDFDHDHEYASHVDEKGSRYKDDRGRRRSADGYDGYHGDKVRRVDSDVDKDRSLSRKPNVDGVASSSRHRASPSSRSYIGPDRYRDGIQDDTKYGDQLRDKTLAEAPDKVSKYRLGEKRANFDENYIGELSERSPSTKASPAGLKERSSPSNFDRSRFPGRSSRRRSLNVDEAERRSIGSNELRDISATEDRQSRDFSAKKSIGDEYPSADSSVYHKSSQGNMSSHGPGPGPGPSPSPGPGPSFFRAGADSPSFVSSFGEDSRGHSGNRYRRSVDPNLGRGPGNAWKGVHNWPSPLPNGFMPFPPPPGPHHGGFPPILSQFPPLFGVRPSMDMNHPGMPYHMADGDRYPGHIRPIGWPSMVDGSIPPHFHGWDGGNGILRDEHMYGPGHPANAQRRDMNAEIWKQNGDIHADVTSGSQKDGNTIKASADEASSAQGASRPNVESSCFEDQGTSLKKDTSSALSPMKEIPFSSAKINTEKTPESSSVDDTAQSLRAYLSKLDVSIDLADPELYNQFINLAVKEQSEYIEDDLELVYTEDKAIVELETPNIIVDVKLFPAAKDSIFQRVMDLYKTQYTKRRNSVGLDGNKICAPASQPEAIQSSLLDETAVFPDDSVMEEEQTLAGPEEIVPSAGEGEGKELECTGVEIQNDDPLPSTEPAIDVGDERLPVLDVEKMEEDAPLDLMSENAPMDLISENAPLDLISKNAPLGLISEDAGKGILPVVSIAAETTDSNTDKGTRSDGDTIYGCESAPGEHLDVAVSSPLNLSDDSVKVCEPLISVPNESESVILSRIHHAPESTH